MSNIAALRLRYNSRWDNGAGGQRRKDEDCSSKRSSMTSRTSEAAYWDTPHSQYHSQSQHYYSSTPSMVSQQQQPRQAPTFNSGPESSSPYSAPPSSNTYYSPFYQSQMNSGMNGSSHNSNAAPSYTTMSSNNGYPSHSSSHGNNGNAHSFGGGPHGVNLPSSHGMAHYPMSNHSGYHLNNSGIYQRSHMSNGNGGGDFAGPMSHAGSDLPHPQSSHQQQAAYHASSQHSGSPTIDGSEYGHGMKQKRRQVKNACVNCQKACKRCDEGRPCTRCIKYGLTDTCQDSARKERKRGIKRGPYKRRATTGSQGPPSSSGSQYPASSPFMVMEGIQSAPFLGHHNNGSHGSLVSPHVRSHRDQQQQQQGYSSSNGGNNMSDVGQGMDSGMLNSPAYPSSATSTMPRTAIPLNSYEAVYNRDHFSSMQPPRFTSRHDYDRNSNSPAQALYSSTRPNVLPPVSAPASSTSFSSSPASGYSSRSLFSPPSLMTTNANFLSAGSHHRLHSDSSVNTMGTGSTAPSLSPRTPMTLSASSSNANIGEMGINGGNTSASSPPGGRSNGQGYIHHPGPTTTANLPPTATGAFLNPSSTAPNNAQPFPLHIPHSARWRSNNVSINGDRDGMIHNRDLKEEQLAPIKLHKSNDSDLSSGTLSIRYQLPSPRMAESPRSENRGGGLPKMDVVA